MSALIVPYWAAAVLLIVAGAPKISDPSSTVRVGRQAGLPAGSGLVRTFGLAEVLVGVAALVLGGPVPAALVAAAYAGFALFVLVGLIRGGLESCGCFAGDQAPPSLLHVGVNLTLCAAALGVLLSASPATGLSLPRTGLLVLALVDAALLYLVLTALPRRGDVAGPARAAQPQPLRSARTVAS